MAKTDHLNLARTRDALRERDAARPEAQAESEGEAEQHKTDCGLVRRLTEVCTCKQQPPADPLTPLDVFVMALAKRTALERLGDEPTPHSDDIAKAERESILAARAAVKERK